ncbi:cyclic peptide export ABC transporter [Rhodovibrionaceae bacterium A322]
MVLLRYFQQYSSIPLRKILLYAGIAGLSNALILGVVNTAAAHVSDGNGSNFWYLAMFLVVLAIYTITQKHIFVATTGEVERIIHEYRVRQVNYIRQCDLDSIERIGKANIFTNITRQPQVISQTAGSMVLAVQSAILIFFTMIYLAILSLWAFYLAIAIMALAIFIYLRKWGETNATIHKTIVEENKLFDGLTDAIDGFKENRLHNKRSRDLTSYIDIVSHTVTRYKVQVDVQLSVLFIMAQATFYMLAAALVFLLPAFGETFSEELLKTTTIVLFIIGPVTSVVGVMSNMATANAACESMIRMEETLKEAATSPKATGEELLDFETIRFEGIVYEHHDRENGVSFRCGPCSFEVHKGQILFISGGNGSGKSTLLMMATGLYHPKEGAIYVDDKLIDHKNLELLQSLFSTVFFNFHLFPRLYGLGEVDQDRLDELLKLMELEKKVELIDGQFDTKALSSGQRKRLAMVIALLEDRPIYVFDEWAADQDPEFRRKFYEVMLPDLKASGKTILAVTHDDRYFDDCDGRIVMEEGRIARMRGDAHVL